MLGRGLLRPMLSLSGRSNNIFAMPMQNININRTVSRPLVLYLTGEEEDAQIQVSIFSQRCELMGADPYPLYKKEKQKRNEKRYMVGNRKIGKRANYKVRGLVDLIEYKRFFKLQ
jgi:hypothetical protein